MQFGPAVLVKELEDGIEFVGDPDEGVLVVTIEPDEIISVGDYMHQLEVTLSSGERLTAARGWFRSIPSVLPAL